MKLNVFLFTDEVIKDLSDLPVIDEHYNWIVLRSKAVNTLSKVSQLIRKYKPVTICTTGKESDWPALFQLPYEYRKKWVHFENMQKITSQAIEYSYMYSITQNRFSQSAPLFSVISTTFHSGEKIFRPYRSLKNQTYTNWEWVIWDDSKEDHTDTWKQILDFQKDDIRISCYRAPQHSGYIGEMKWRSASLCKGEWIVEIDHDDIVDSRLFEWCNEAIAKYPDADFLCSSCVELFEDDEKAFSYSDFTAYGYGYYHKEWLRGKWHNVYHVPHMNPKTIRYIVGVPNHVRIWRRSFYERIGRHNPDLPVVDDYELLIRSYLEGKWVNIDAPTYFQYRNRGGNNFTFLRNSLIQHLTKKTCALYDEQIDKLWKSREIPNEYSDIYKVWERAEGFSYNKGYPTYTPGITENTVSIVLTVENDSSADILKSVDSVVKQGYKDWLLYIVGNKSKTLDNTMNKVRELYDDSVISKVRWWNLETKLTRQVSLNYAHRMLINSPLISYIEVGKEWDVGFLQNGVNVLRNSDKQFWTLDSGSESEKTLYNSIHRYDILRNCSELTDSVFKHLCTSE